MLRYGTPVAAALAIIAVGLNFYFDWMSRGGPIGPQGPGGPLSMTNQVTGAALNLPVADLSKAVFLVVTEGEDGRGGTATAFLVDNRCGVFATNAHVAATYGAAKRLVVRQPQSTVELPVTGVKIHPAFDLMTRTFDSFGPILSFRNLKDGVNVERTSPIVQFDVALLYTRPMTAEGGCEDAALPLPRALALAAKAELALAGPGAPIAVIGYPGTGSFSSTEQAVVALPRVDFGIIRAVGTTLPPAKAGQPPGPLDRVLFHSAPTIAGSSGSPIFNAFGRVIAIHARGTGGEYLTRRYQEGAADRIEPLIELLTNQEQAALPAYEAAINARLKDYDPASKLARARATQAIAETAKKLGMREALAEGSVIQLEFGEEAETFCLNADKDCVSAKGMSQHFTTGRFASVDVPLDTAKINMLTMVDFDLDKGEPQIGETENAALKEQEQSDILCPLVIWEAEAQASGSYTVVRQSELETLASILVPARHKGQASAKLVIFRPDYCSQTYRKAQLVVTPFALEAGPREDLTASLLERMVGAVGQALNSAGETIMPAQHRSPHAEP
jgi:S1-C subfamily serine protease